MRESLGYTGQKDPLTRDDSTIKIEITLKEAAAEDLDVTIFGQAFGEYVYESNSKGNKAKLYAYKLREDAEIKNSTRFYSTWRKREKNESSELTETH